MKKNILYFGTYEKKYPRNTCMTQALRRSGANVVEIQNNILGESRHKFHLCKSPVALLKFIFLSFIIYLKLCIQLIKIIRKYDEIWIGYIGQIDVLIFSPITRIFQKKMIFNPMISLYDTIVVDRKIYSEKVLIAKIIWVIDWLSFHFCDEIIIDTEGQKEFIHKAFGIQLKKIQVIPLMVEKIFKPMKCKKDQKDANFFTVLYFGKIIPLHGLDKVLYAMKYIQTEKIHNIQLKIAGEGQLALELQTLTSQLGLTNTHWLGWIENDELPLLINKSDLCLGIFGDSEKSKRVIPNKVWQSIACGKKVVTQFINDKDAVNIPSGIIQIPSTSKSIAAAILNAYAE